MLTSLLSRFSKSRRPSSDDQPVVDISRVIPEFKGAQPASEVSEPAMEAASAEDTPASLPSADSNDPAAEDTLVLSAPVSEADRAEQAVEALSDDMNGWIEADLERLYSAWQAAQADINDIGRLVLAAHDLKGMAATYGYPAVSRIATSLCTLIERRTSEADFPLINLHIEACRAAVKESAASDNAADAVAQSVCAALEAQVNRVLAA